MVVALLVLAALLAAWVWNIARPSRRAALVLVILCALWLPANNRHLEGPLLVNLDEKHGLTLSDLLSYGGFVLAVVSVRRWSRAERHRAGRAPRWVFATVLGLGVVFVLGMVVTWTFQGRLRT